MVRLVKRAFGVLTNVVLEKPTPRGTTHPLVPVVKVLWNGVNATPVWSFTAALTLKRYCMLGCRHSAGVNTITSKPPLVLMLPGIFVPLDTFVRVTDVSVSVVSSTPPPFGRFRSAATDVSSATPVALFAGLIVLTDGVPA